MKNKIFILLLLFSSINLLQSLEPGDLDPLYNSAGSQPGTNTVTVTGSAVVQMSSNAIQSDQKCVAVGTNFDGVTNNILLSRFNNDGTLDTATFNSAGTQPGVVVTALAGTQVTGVVIQDDQLIDIAGVTTTQPTVPTGNARNLIVARYTTSGALDSSFGSNPFGGGFAGIMTINVGFDSIATSLAIEPGTNSIVAAGTCNASTDIVLAKFTSNGSIDTDFGGGTGFVITTPADVGGIVGVLQARDIKTNQNGSSIFICGNTDTTLLKNFVAKYNKDGTLDTTFNSAGAAPGFAFFPIAGASDIAPSLVIQNDGKIVVGVAANDNVTQEMAVTRFNADGTVDTGFGTNGVTTVQSNSTDTVLTRIALQSNQKIVAVGFTDGVGTSDFIVARFNTDGALDSTFIDSNTSTPAGTVSTIFNGGVTQLAKAVSIQSNQDIVASGDNGATEILMARYLSVGTTFIAITSPTPNEVLTNAQPTITGTMEVGNLIVQISIDGGAFVSATTINSGAGTWSFTPSSSLSQGSHTVQARTINPNTATALSTVVPFSIDSATSVTITFPTSNETINNAQPTITGTMEVGNTIVQVSIDSGTLQNATVNSGAGTWTFTPGVSLADGDHTVQAFTEDPLGNTAQTAVIPFTVDTTTFVTITSPTPNEVVNNQKPLITGTMEVGNTIVQVSIDGGALQNASVISGSGTWSFTPSSILTNGSHTVQAFTTDQVGNTVQTAVIPFTVDAQTFVTITSPKNGETITTSRPLLTGTTAPGNTIEIIIDGVSVGFATADSSGNWIFQVTSPLTNGVHTIEIIATTPTGDVASVTINITVQAAACISPADILTLAISNKYSF